MRLYFIYVYHIFLFNSVHTAVYPTSICFLLTSVNIRTIFVLRRILPEHNNFSSFCYLSTFSLFSPPFFVVYCCTRVLDEHDFTSRCVHVRACVHVYMCMDIRRKSYDVLPATGPSWFPPLATTLRGVKRRQNDRGWNIREGPRDGAK